MLRQGQECFTSIQLKSHLNTLIDIIYTSIQFTIPD